MSRDDISHRYAELGEVLMHYVEAGSGFPLLLLHGWPQTWYEWRQVIPELSKHFRVIAPDLRGLGDTSRPGGPGIPFKNGPGRIGLAVSLGHVAIEPGDIVVGDQDGIVVIPLVHVRQTLKALEDARSIESDLESVVEAGTAVPPYAEDALLAFDVNYVR